MIIGLKWATLRIEMGSGRFIKESITSLLVSIQIPIWPKEINHIIGNIVGGISGLLFLQPGGSPWIAEKRKKIYMKKSSNSMSLGKYKLIQQWTLHYIF